MVCPFGSEMIYGNHNKDELEQYFNIKFDGDDQCYFTSDTIYYWSCDSQSISIYHYGNRYCTKYCEVPIDGGYLFLEATMDCLYYSIKPETDTEDHQTLLMKMDKYGDCSIKLYANLFTFDFAYDNIWQFQVSDESIKCLTDERKNIEKPGVISDGHSFYYVEDGSIYQLCADYTSVKIIDVKRLLNAKRFNIASLNLIQVWKGKAFLISCNLGYIILYPDGKYIIIKDFDWTANDFISDNVGRSLVHLHLGKQNRYVTWDMEDGQCYDGECIKLPDIKWKPRTYAERYVDLDIVHHI